MRITCIRNAQAVNSLSRLSTSFFQIDITYLHLLARDRRLADDHGEDVLRSAPRFHVPVMNYGIFCQDLGRTT
jgi:hypothetical protein